MRGPRPLCSAWPDELDTESDPDELETRTLPGSSTTQDESLQNGAALLLLFGPTGPAHLESHLLADEPLLLGRFEPLFGGHKLEDSHLSRRHADVQKRGGRYVLTDLGSRNRARVNGVELTSPRVLDPGDVIRLGDTLFMFTSWLPNAADLADTELVGATPAIAAVRDAVRRVAERDTTVLITGETGVGKDVVARMLHRRSGRAGSLIAVNCGGLSEGVLESELFGHVRGAFTGAVEKRDGLFRAASGGTLFLDELGEMPLAFQVKLLRVLETGKIRPIGASQELPVDVRVVAATHRNVTAEVSAGRFRTDLYSRLAQWTIAIPPLRERRADIPLLVRELLTRSQSANRTMESPLAESLLLHEWPLNVRGLANAVSVAIIASEPGEPLRLDETVRAALADQSRIGQRTPPAPSTNTKEQRNTSNTGNQGEDDDADPPLPIPMPSREEIEASLTRYRGNVSDAARYLGLSRQKLYRWISANEIDLERFRKSTE